MSTNEIPEFVASSAKPKKKVPTLDEVISNERKLAEEQITEGVTVYHEMIATFKKC